MITQEGQKNLIRLITTAITLLTPSFTISFSQVLAQTTAEINQNYQNILLAKQGLSEDKEQSILKEGDKKQEILEEEEQDILKEGDKKQGILEEGDFVIPSDGSLFDEYTFDGKKNQSIKITLESSDFPTILLLIDPNGNWVKKNFDLRKQKPHSSVIQITLPQNGIYRVVVNGYQKEHRGKYTLSLIESNLPQTAFDNSHNFPEIEGENNSPMEQKAKAERLYKQGLQQYSNRNWKQAIISCEEALVLYRQLGNKIKVSFLKEVIKGLEFYLQGNNHFERGEFNQALNKYQEISKLLANLQTQIERNGTVIGISPRDLALAIAGNHIDIGSVYLVQSENTKAEENFKQGLEVSQRINYPLGQAFAYNSLGQVSFDKSEHITALIFYRKALEIHIEIIETEGVSFGVYSVLNNIAVVYFAQGKYAKALDTYQQSLEIVKKNNLYLSEATTLNNIAVVYKNQGEFAKALETYQQAKDIYQKHKARSGEATTLLNIGSFYYSIGRYREAFNYYEKALKTFSEIKIVSRKASAFRGIGSVKKQQGQLIEALESYQQALNIFKNIGYRKSEGYTLGHIGSLNYDLENYEEALKYFREGLEIAKSIEDPILKSSLYNQIGLVHQEQKKYAEAFESYQKALSISRDIEGDKDGEHQILHNIGRLNLTLKQYQEAEKNLLSSIKIKESLRGGLSDINKISIIDTQLNSYSALQQVLISQNKINQALEISERARTRAFVELLAQRIAPQLEKPPSYPNLKQIKQIAIEQNATIVEYSLINNPDEEQEIYIWVIKPTGEITFRQVKLPSSGIPEKTSLTKLIQTARQLIDDNNNFKIASRSQNESSLFSPGTFIHFKEDEADWEPWQVISFDSQQRTITVTHPSFDDGVTIQRSIDDVARKGQTTLQQLYELLIEPIEDVLPTDEQERVIFVPDGSLFLLPFPALQNAQGNYLIEKHTIVTAPSIQVLDATRQIKQKRQPFNQSPLKPQDALIIGNPNPMPEGFSLLDNADKEAIEIATLLNTKAFIGSEATETAMVKQMSQARLIHLATHGTFEDTQGLDSSIILAPTSLDNGKLTASEIFSLNLNAELVVLSACDTGRGRITGDGVIGLSRSLIAAGVESVVVSLWAVDDAATADLMVEFYRQMQQDLGKAQALRQAMLMTMKQNPSPKYWAGFTLIGEAE